MKKAIRRSEENQDGGIEEVDGDNFEEIGEEEELTRGAIKKASEQLSSANDRRTKKRGKKKKKPSRDR